MAQVTCRVPPVLDDALDAVATEAGLFRSDVLKQALVFYMARNPDDFEAFRENHVGDGIKLLRGNRPSQQRNASQQATYDPLEEL